MNKEIEFYESKLQDLYTRLGKANELVCDLKISKENVKHALEKIEEENHHLMDENEFLCKRMAESQLKLLTKTEPKKINQARRSLTLSIPLDEIEEKDTPTLSDHESDEDISQDPNIEKFLRQINELKAVCQQQGEALVKFQETMESTKEDNDRLQVVLSELENEKKGNEMFGNSELRCSLTFENLPSPVAMRSLESSMFISALDVNEFEIRENRKIITEKHFHRPEMNVVKTGLLYSHILGLKI